MNGFVTTIFPRYASSPATRDVIERNVEPQCKVIDYEMNDQVSEDDDTPRLSEHAMAALMEFYAEQDAVEKAENKSSVAENWVIKNSKYFHLLNHRFTICRLIL